VSAAKAERNSVPLSPIRCATRLQWHFASVVAHKVHKRARCAGTNRYREKRRSSSELSLAPISTTTIEIHIQVIKPKIAPSEP
jgi:hypothetical protein